MKKNNKSEGGKQKLLSTINETQYKPFSTIYSLRLVIKALVNDGKAKAILKRTAFT